MRALTGMPILSVSSSTPREELMADIDTAAKAGYVMTALSKNSANGLV
jgi:hypothetical protein